MHRIVTGPSHETLFSRVDALDALFVAELHKIAAKIAPHIQLRAAVTAALGDEPPEEPYPADGVPTPEAPIVIDWAGLSIIQSLWVDAVAYGFMPQLVEIYRDAATEVYDGLTVVVPSAEDKLPPVTNLASEEYLAAAKNRMVGVGDRLWQEVKSQLEDGVARGESITELKDRLVTAANLTEARASTVARTEVISASNAGSYAQARVAGEFGLDIQKEWLATEDARTRPTHAAANGQRVELDAPFTVGGSQLQFPGDPSGPADEIINCRCTQTYVVDGEEPAALAAEAQPALTASTWVWNGVDHATFCMSPKHPGPCKGWKGPESEPVTHHHKKTVHSETSHHHAGGGGGGGGGGGIKEGGHLEETEHKSKISSLSAAQKKKVYDDFKGHKGVSPAYSGKAIYESVQHAKNSNPDLDLSDSDVLDIIDEHAHGVGAHKAGPTAYKDKVTSWLQTPNGKKHAVSDLSTKEHAGKVHVGKNANEPGVKKPSIAEPSVGEGTPSAAPVGPTTGPLNIEGTKPTGYHVADLSIGAHSQAYEDLPAAKKSQILGSAKNVYTPAFVSDEDIAGNIAGVAALHGISPADAALALDDANHLSNVHVAHMLTHFDEGAGSVSGKQMFEHQNKLFTAGKSTSSHIPKHTPESKVIDEHYGDVSHLTAKQQAQIHADFTNEVGKYDWDSFEIVHAGQDESEIENAVHAIQLQAFANVAQKHGITPLQAIKASDLHTKSGGAFESELVGHFAANNAPGGLPQPKPPKINKADLPNGDYGATGYKSLPPAVKMKLGTTADAHKLYVGSDEAHLKGKAIKADFDAAISEAKLSEGLLSYYVTEPKHIAAAADVVAAKYGISPIQAAKVHDAVTSYHYGKNYQTSEKALYAHYKSLNANVTSSGKPKKLPDTSTFTEEKQKFLGQSHNVDEIPDIQQFTIFQAMQQQGIHPGSSNAAVMSAAAKVGTHLGQSPHDVLKIMDSQSAKLSGQPNVHHYEAKGLAHVKQAPLGKLYSATATHTVYGGVIKSTGPHVVPVPKNKNGTKNAEYKVINGAQAQKMQDEQMGAFTPTEQAALKKYTSSYYKDVNTYLRTGGSSNSHAASVADKIQSAMRPTTQDLILMRGAAPHDFGVSDMKDVVDMVGKVYENRGFLSTSVGGKAAFHGKVNLTIRAPKGTHAAYVDKFSHFKGENELLLAAGTRYRVISVSPPTGGTHYGGDQWQVTVEITSDDITA